MAAEPNFIEYAKSLFWAGYNDADALSALSKAMKEKIPDRAQRRQRAKDIAEDLLEEGYGFLPGLAQYAKNKQETEDPSFRAAPANREELDRYLEEQGKQADDELLKAEHPFLRAVAPHTKFGQLKDRRTDGGSAGNTAGRLAADLVTDIFALPAAVAGKGLNYVDRWHNYKFADPGNTEGFFRDPVNDLTIAASIVNPALWPFGVARVAKLAGLARAAERAGKVGSFLNRADKVGRAARFAAESGADAVGAYGGSRLSDQTPEYSLPESVAGGVLGATVSRALPLGAEGVSVGAEKAAKAAERAAVGKEAADVGLQEIPPVWRMNRGPARKVGTTDEYVRYAMDPKHGLGLRIEDIPSGALSERGALNPAQGFERTLISSPSAEPFRVRWDNFNEILNKRARDIVGDVDPYETVIELRRQWPTIERNMYGDYFNMSNAFERRPEISGLLEQADAQKVAEIASRYNATVSPEGMAAADKELGELSLPKQTMDYLNRRIAKLRASKENVGGIDMVEGPDKEELKTLLQFRNRISARGISPLQRLKSLDDIRQHIDDKILRNKNAVVTPDFVKVLRGIKRKVLDDQEALLSNREWFGDVVDDAVPLWKDMRKKAAIFEEGHDALDDFLNPAEIKDKKLKTQLSNSRYFNEAVKRALEMGGKEGAEMLERFQRLALDGALAEEKKTGIPFTSALNRYNDRNRRAVLESIMGADNAQLDEMRKILELGSRAAGAEEAGSAFGRNANLNTVDLLKLKRRYAAARKMAEADQGIGAPSKWSDLDEFMRIDEGLGAGEQVAPYVPKEVPLAPNVPNVSGPVKKARPIVKKVAKVAVPPAKVAASVYGRTDALKDADRALASLGLDPNEVPPDYLTDAEKKMWVEFGWRPRPDVGGFAVE